MPSEDNGANTPLENNTLENNTLENNTLENNEVMTALEVTARQICRNLPLCRPGKHRFKQVGHVKVCEKCCAMR